MASREYAKVGPQFWTGHTGRALRKLGPDVQLAALYLLTCGSANMIGLYYLPVALMAHEMGSPFEGASKALTKLSEAGFCAYDEERDLVWVCEMARFQIDEALKPGDNRIRCIERLLDEHASSPLVAAFVRKYRVCFHLRPREVAVANPTEAPLLGPSEAPTEAPSKGLPEALGKPESREQRTEERETPRARVTPLVRRRNLHAVFEWERGCVPQDLHADLVAKLGGDPAEADQRLLAFYRETAATWPADAVVDGNDWAFWRARYAERFAPPPPTRAEAPRPPLAGRVPAPSTWADPARVWRCHHGLDACESRTACELRTAREVGEGHVRLEDVPAPMRKAVQAMSAAYGPQAVHA